MSNDNVYIPLLDVDWTANSA